MTQAKRRGAVSADTSIGVQSPCDMILQDKVRSGCKDIWNAFMAKDAVFGPHDIPLCPTTAQDIPVRQITWEQAKLIHTQHISRKEYDYYEDAFINWYIDDYKFDGVRGIWHDNSFVLRVLRHFAGAITPDFSTYQDFPIPIKEYATYRMRLFGYWLGKEGIAIINNVRWGTEESFEYCFEGIPLNSIVSIGTVAGGPRKLRDRIRFENGFYKMIEVLKPHTILVYGSAKGKCFDNARKLGITIASYQSRTAEVYAGRRQHEQR